MAENDSGERTEQATPRRREEARKKGQVVRSRELTTASITIGGAAGLWMLGGDLAQALEQMTRGVLVHAGETIDSPNRLLGAFGEAILLALYAALPILLLLFVISLLSSIAIGGLHFSAEAIQPKFDRLSPFKGLSRMFGTQALVELVKAAGKFIVLGLIAALILRHYTDEFLTLGRSGVRETLTHALDLLVQTFLLVSLSLLVIVAIDLPFQIWNFNQQLKMSKQEVREEYKEMEGKPEVKGRIRRMQRELAQRRMMQKVPQADVVITNPEHFAVALKYDPGKPGAPMVLAKGIDFMALQIRQVAAAHNVQIFEAPPLARALYHTTEIDQEIPEGLYLAVAQVLAYVFSLRQFGAAGSRPPPKDYPIPEQYRY
ncbi:flagellar biosynthesis protein FlhB [Permianibacter sp. IMCC34836]|uniref:flagellar biosynthesis protein FlhB n=1 Tax=Permianibacter fluminis TaxID=2738515 RepID=UPI001551BA57|nr:flagellar biosynthesis protein FlhB [Permianibacter fluminis]NQD38023.1 flagellar biosynthesis protein FlhB [Permianibacter fluminis]